LDASLLAEIKLFSDTYRATIFSLKKPWGNIKKMLKLDRNDSKTLSKSDIPLFGNG